MGLHGNKIIKPTLSEDLKSYWHFSQVSIVLISWHKQWLRIILGTDAASVININNSMSEINHYMEMLCHNFMVYLSTGLYGSRTPSSIITLDNGYVHNYVTVIHHNYVHNNYRLIIIISITITINLHKFVCIYIMHVY